MKNIFIVSVVVSCLAITGCTPPLQEQTPQILTGVPGLEDCTGLKFESQIYVFRCPGSVTSTSQANNTGKTTSYINSVVEDLHGTPKAKSTNSINPNGLTPYQQCVISAVQNNKPIDYIAQACDPLK